MGLDEKLIARDYNAMRVIQEIVGSEINDTDDYRIIIKDHKITSLSICNKGLTSIPNEVSQIVDLEWLDLSANKITEIKGLGGLTKMRNLYLHRNYITEIKGLEQLENLQMLILDGNYITEIKGLDGLKNLKTLYLENNRISTIQGLEQLENLQDLSLARNNISYIEGLEHNLSKLKNLNLWGNKLHPNTQTAIQALINANVTVKC